MKIEVTGKQLVNARKNEVWYLNGPHFSFLQDLSMHNFGCCDAKVTSSSPLSEPIHNTKLIKSLLRNSRRFK